MNKKSGFTLAEVLVTLMIIGVIAAMTIPSLMQSTAQQEFRAAFKKAVSMINQAVTLNYALDGMDASSPYGKEDFFSIMTQRLNVLSSTSDSYEMYTADGMWFSTQAGTDQAGNTTFTRIATDCDVNAENANAPENICAYVTVDVNGKKGPNKLTTATNKIYDIFMIAVYPQKAFPGNNIMSEVLYSK